MFIRGKFSSPYVDSGFDATECKLILKNSGLKSWLRFCLSLWRTRK